MNDFHENDFLLFARHALNLGTSRLDPDTVARIREIRNRATNISARPRRRWLPAAGGMLATAMAVLLVVLWPDRPPETMQMMALEDVNLLASDADLDMFIDLDFYRWLETVDHAG